MSETIPYVYVFVIAMIWRVISYKKGFSFEIFNGYEFKNKNYGYIEKFIMFLLPILIAILYFLNSFDILIIKLLLIFVILVDFLLQYIYKISGWIVFDREPVLSKEFIWWVVLAVLIILII